MKENIEETKETQGDQKKVELDSKDNNEEKHDERSELFDTAETSDGSTPGLSKRAKKKLLKRQAWLDSKPERKALEKLKRREKLDKRKAEDPDLPSYSESRKRIKNVYVEKIKSPINIVFDMSFGDKMNQRDRGKCLKQLLRCYSLNRRFDHPLNLHFSNFDGIMKEEMSQRHQGFENWDIQFHTESHAEVFLSDEKEAAEKCSKNDIVYLSSESENVIGEEGFEPNKTYIIGALVDHNLHKGLCYSLAKDAGISHARLPIDEFVNIKTRKVLSIDHVFHIIGSVVSQKMSWADAFLSILPDRKGAELKEETSEPSNQESITGQEN